MMDPFIYHSKDGTSAKHTGRLHFNLGDISEDILRDGRKSFENGLPTSSTVVDVDTTIWGRVPITQPVVNAFDNNEDARMYQDIGYDGLGSTHGLNDEQSFFADYLQRIANRFGTQSDAYKQAVVDPSSDDYRYFRSSYYDDGNVKINDRYKLFNNPEGNSPVDSDSEEDYITAGSSYPNVEDINRDNTLSEAENYYQYVIDLSPDQMQIGQNHIVDIQEAKNVQLANGETTTCKWYQFRIPVRQPDQTVGKISGFQIGLKYRTPGPFGNGKESFIGSQVPRKYAARYFIGKETVDYVKMSFAFNLGQIRKFSATKKLDASMGERLEKS
jgi:cell surface protein SprA